MTIEIPNVEDAGSTYVVASRVTHFFEIGRPPHVALHIHLDDGSVVKSSMSALRFSDRLNDVLATTRAT